MPDWALPSSGWAEPTGLNPLSANPTKLSNTLKQLVSKLPTNCLSIFDHFVGLRLKGLIDPLFSHHFVMYEKNSCKSHTLISEVKKNKTRAWRRNFIGGLLKWFPEAAVIY